MTRSLQFRLSLWLSLTIIGVAVAAGVISFASAFDEAIELQDDQLRLTASLIGRHRFSVPPAEGPNMAPDVTDIEPESRLVVLRQQPLGAWAPDGELPGVDADLPDGLQTVTIAGVPWRLFVKTLDPGARILVGQQTAVRDEIARSSALRTVAPLLSLVLLLPLLAGYIVRNMLRPLKRMAAELEFRSERDWQDIADDGVPSEIRPFVVAIKRLLARVAQSLSAQRRFVADAAHELRTPLTALSLQAERLEEAAMSDEARERLAALRAGIRRTRALLDQLLTLARTQRETGETGPVSLDQVFRQVLEDLMPLAEAKRLDIGVVSRSDVVVQANEPDLMILVKNLVENAIRYTPEGGRIDLAVETTPGGTILRVDDTGPGIPPAERARVFDPFYRVLGSGEIGSGLGLSIVKTIADRLGASVALGQSNDGGLRVTVTLPGGSVSV
ncbi:two-component sensor histidine kinase [Aliidongia dinghuensis]|uniref:histidine kinase n=1 Tax=Aliidongia dinghuensis TaxID=1867774 RepID=A0A8J3E291_9PROT|nr:two-component sensor histidine kinase [Aliidongia dinghuensis]